MPDLEQKSGTETDKGFPAETKIVDMKPEEQAAYWKFQSRKHEGNANNLKAELEGKNKPEVKPEAKPETNAPLDAATLRKEILAELKKEQAPGLARTQFETLIGDRLPEATRNALLDNLNLNRFVKEDGSVDKDLIKAQAELLAPATDDRQVRKTRTHQGNRRQEASASVESGKTLYEEFSKKR